jgi:hypothetical protein
MHTITKLLTDALHLGRRRIRIPQQRLNHLRQDIAIALAAASWPSLRLPSFSSPPALALAAHHLQCLRQRVESGAHVARDRDSVRSCAGLIGADFGERREEGG